MSSLTIIIRALILSLLLVSHSGVLSQSLNSSVTFNSESLNNVKILINPWHLEKITDDYVYLSSFEFKLNNSSFTTSLDLKTLAFVRVTIKGFKDTRPIFFIRPGDNIVIEVEKVNGALHYVVNGNELNDVLSIWNKTVQPYYENRMNSKFYQQRLDFIKEYPDLNFSAFLLIGDKNGMTRFPADTLTKYSGLLSKNAWDGYYGQIIKDRVDNLGKVQVGMNLYGTSIDSILFFSNHEGKIIVVDFWATWCRSCVVELPEIKSAFLKYKNQAHFISVSADRDKQKWERFVKGKKMTWEQVLDSTNIAHEMGVDIYPTKFIINSSGIVTNIYIGDHPEFFTELDALILQKEDD